MLRALYGYDSHLCVCNPEAHSPAMKRIDNVRLAVVATPLQEQDWAVRLQHSFRYRPRAHRVYLLPPNDMPPAYVHNCAIYAFTVNKSKKYL